MTQISTTLLGWGALLAGAAALGSLGGYLFYRLWRAVLPRACSRALLQRLPADVRAMLTEEEPSEMLKHYRAVLLGISSFGLRNAAALTAGLLPVAALFLLLAGLDPSGSAATELEVHPPELELAPGAWTLRDGRMRASRSDIVPKGITLAGGAELRSDRLAKKLALCASSPACVLFDMMLFETQHAPGLERSIVVRPVFLDVNPLWPYVNDLELAFFAAVTLGSAVAMRWHRRNEKA